MIIYILIILLLLVFIFKNIFFLEHFITPSNNQCVKLDEKCIVYKVGSDDESNNCCSGYCVRKNNNFQYKVCSDKPEYICGKLGNNNLQINTTTRPPTTLDNSLNGKKLRFCNAPLLDWSLFDKSKHKNENKEEEEEEENNNLYNPYENISTNKCGIFNFGGVKNSTDTALNRSGTKCNGFFTDLF